MNDVVLAICAHGTEGALARRRAIAGGPDHRHVPGFQKAGDEAADGNLISAMLVSLATDIASPRERLLAIQKNTQQAKQFNRESKWNRLSGGSLAAGLFGVKTYTRFRVAKR